MSGSPVWLLVVMCAWALDIALSAEKRLVVRRHLKFRTNQLTVLYGGRASLPHRAPVQSAPRSIGCDRDHLDPDTFGMLGP